MENDPPGPPPLTYGIFHMFRRVFFESFPYVLVQTKLHF